MGSEAPPKPAPQTDGTTARHTVTAAPQQPAGELQHAGKRKRLALGRTRRRLRYEQQVWLWFVALSVPSLISVTTLWWLYSRSAASTATTALVVALLWWLAASLFLERLVRPLQTLANVVAALREEDFTFRARGASRGDALGDLAMEVNALAANLQNQRSSAHDALTLVERVLTSMQSPVLAFDHAGDLRLLNPAAESVFALERSTAIGRSAVALHLALLLQTSDGAVFSGLDSGARTAAGAAAGVRWAVRRSSFRLQGVPHTLLVLSDVAAALREEERQAWQRLIRVLSHEINNSLTPIKSLAGSLRAAVARAEAADDGESPAGRRLEAVPGGLQRGLLVIEERADALNRFLQSYQQLTRLPQPHREMLSLRALLDHALQMETRVPVWLEPGPNVVLLVDRAQIQQLLINLLHNAAEASLSPDSPESSGKQTAKVCVRWTATGTHVTLQIHDNGPGLLDATNLFVPFYTTKAEGSGIGLVLAQQIAYAHKGTITLYNSPTGTGCIAEVQLPLEADL